jgi:hypothetical protein
MNAPRFVKICLLFICLLAQQRVNAQLGKDTWGVTGEIMLPSGMASKPFRAYMNGLVNVHPKIVYKPLTNWYVAAGPKYMYYTVSEFKLPTKSTGGMHAFGGGLEFGYMKWIGKQFAFEAGIKGGAMQHAFHTGLLPSSKKLLAGYIEPGLTFIIAADEAVSYRWSVGYNWMGFHLMPEHLGLETYGGYTLEEYEVGAQSLVVGFGITYYFGNERGDTFIEEAPE